VVRGYIENKKFNALSVDGRVLCYGGWIKDINGVKRVGRGYIVNFPHPMHFLRVLCYGGWIKEGKKYMGCGNLTI
jgi:hypothetical protein